MKIERPTVSPEEMALLLELAKDKTVLELGAGYGWSAVELIKSARQVWSVDWHRGDDQAGWGDTLGAYFERTRDYIDSGRIVALVGRFEWVLPYLRAASFGLIFHDGHHSAPSVEADLRLALPLLEWGGWVAAHDYGLFSVREGSLPILGEPDLQVRSLAAWRPDAGHWHSAGGRPGAGGRGVGS